MSNKELIAEARELIAHTRTYNFGMWSADKLAHEVAGKLVDALVAAERERGEGELAGMLERAQIAEFRKAKVEALREAADDINVNFQDIPAWMETWRRGERTDDWVRGGVQMVGGVLDYLRARADELEGVDPQESDE